jgi:NAD+ kinase
VAKIALVHQPYRPDTGEIARRVERWLASNGHDARLLSAFELVDGCCTTHDLALSFGGDGTTLRTARWAARGGVPIIPIGMGTLSFLAELHPNEIEERLDAYITGDYWRDERAMLELSVGEQSSLALNEVVVARGGALRAISVDLHVHGHFVTQFTADGVVVATATGSTAYALAAGGPVLAPELRDIVVAPIAGHLSALRSLVLPETVDLRLMVARRQAAVASADGQVDFDLQVGQSVDVRVAKQRTVFARRGNPGDFYAHLTERLRRS